MDPRGGSEKSASPRSNYRSPAGPPSNWSAGYAWRSPTSAGQTSPPGYKHCRLNGDKFRALTAVAHVLLT